MTAPSAIAASHSSQRWKSPPIAPLNPLRHPGAGTHGGVPDARSGRAGKVTEADGPLDPAGQGDVDIAGIGDAARSCDHCAVGGDLTLADPDRDVGTGVARRVRRRDLDIPGTVECRGRGRRGGRHRQKSQDAGDDDCVSKM